MLTVGIHENVKLGDSTDLNEKGTLRIMLKQGSTGGAFDAFMNDEALAEEAGIFMFPPNVLEFGKTTAKQPNAIAKDLQKFQTYLKGILRIYLTEDKVDEYVGSKGMQKIFNLQGVTKDNFDQKLINQQFIDEVIHSLSKQFVNAVKDNSLGSRPETFRIKLTRQSQKSHFPTFPKSTFDAWIESMEIPADKSKIKWSDYEIKGKWNSPVPSDADVTSESDANKADAEFKNKEDRTTVKTEIDEIFPPQS